MVYDLLQSSPDPHWKADACIVGAGAAGILLACKLSQRGKRVLLLDGGGAALEDAAQDPYRSFIEGRHHRGVHDGRFRVYGGTTTKWGGQILELDENDFEKRPWVRGSGWPFPKTTLRPFYRQALAMEGLESVLATDSAAWSAVHEEEPCLPDVDAYLSRWCPEPNLARLYRKVLTESPSIHVWLHANAVALVIRNERIQHVRTCTQNGRCVPFQGTDYIFCMGGIESSRFFLQQGEGAQPWNRSGLLGRNFQDHIDCNVAEFREVSRPAVDHVFAGLFHRGYKYQPKIKLPAHSQRRLLVLNAAATLSYGGRQAEGLAQARVATKHLMHRHWKQITASDIGVIARNVPHLLRQAHRYARVHRSYQPPSAAVSLRVHCEQEPTSESRIVLDTSRDSLGLFRTKLYWHISELELRTIRAMTLAAKSALSGIAVLKLCDGFDDDAKLRDRCEDSFHHMGGMRMDPSPMRGVVDTDLRLHGIGNAWVCSSAVFPTSGFSNPTHTLLALAMRLAEHLSRSE